MKKILLIGLFVSTLISSQAFGLTINFGDSQYYWPGWASPISSENGRDEIGYPIFPGTPLAPGSAAGSVVFNNAGNVTNITLNYQMASGSFYSNIKPGDLFIDVGKDGTWDYVVRLYPGNGSAGTYHLYSLSLPLNSSTGYVLSNFPVSADIRDQHPVAVNGTVTLTLKQDVSFDGWKYTAGLDSSSIDFGTSGFNFGGPFILGFTVNCANDVIYEPISAGVPEPATMLLLGSGLLGLAGFARKRFKK